MYLINNTHYATSIKEISKHYGAPYRRLLNDIKQHGNTHIRFGGELIIVKKINKLESKNS